MDQEGSEQHKGEGHPFNNGMYRNAEDFYHGTDLHEEPVAVLEDMGLRPGPL